MNAPDDTRELGDKFPIGSLWRHYATRHVYRVVGYPLCHDDVGDVRMVRYLDPTGGEHVRRPNNFARSFTRVERI